LIYLQQYKLSEPSISQYLFSLLLPSVLTLVNLSVADYSSFLKIFSDHHTHLVVNAVVDDIVLAYVQLLLFGFAIVESSSRTTYLSLVFPLLCQLLVTHSSTHSQDRSFATISSSSSLLTPLQLLIGKGLTNIATTLPDVFRNQVQQVSDVERLSLQSIMRTVIQMQQQQ
jgi:hypothetical protein